MEIKYTRKQYMDNEVSHEDYYGQFVTPRLLEAVRAFRAIPKGNGGVPIGAAECKDKHFNDIELKRWDWLTEFLSPEVVFAVAKANASTTAGNVPSISQADKVCVVKAAARQIRGW